NEKSDSARKSHYKFCCIYGAYGVAWVAPLAQQGGGNDRSPASAANGIQKSPGCRQYSDPFGFVFNKTLLNGFSDDDKAQNEHVKCNVGFYKIPVNDIGKQVSSGYGSQNAWDKQTFE